MNVRTCASRPVSRLRVVLLMIAVAVLAVAVPTIYLARNVDPGRANAILDELEIPNDWRLQDTEWHPAPISMSRVVRYYLVRGEPESVAAVGSATLATAGFSTEGSGDPPYCSSNHVPPATICAFLVQIDGGAQVLQLLVLDRRGAASLGDTPWLAASAPDAIVVRLMVHY